MQNIKMLQEKSQKENFDLLSEFANLGFKLVSHTFAFQKEQEIHYYIFEL